MPWSSWSKLDTHAGVFWVGHRGTEHFLRTFTGVSRFDLTQTAKQIWSHPFQDDHAFSYKPVVLTDQAIVTTTHRNKKPDNVWLVALDPQSGKLLWERRLAWRLNRVLGGIYGTGQRIAFIEDEKNPQLFVLDATTGAVIHTGKGVKPLGGAIAQRSGQAGALIDNWLYYAVMQDGLYRADISSDKPELKRVVEDDIRIVIGETPYLYLRQWTSSGQGLISLDGLTGQERGRITLPSDWEIDNVRPARSAHPGYVFVFFANSGGLALVDVEQQRVCWHIGIEEGWQVTDVVDTPHSTVAAFVSAVQPRLASINLQTGEWSLLADDLPADMVYWTGENLISSNSFEVAVLRWKGER
jgi:hypothetical protein